MFGTYDLSSVGRGQKFNYNCLDLVATSFSLFFFLRLNGAVYSNSTITSAMINAEQMLHKRVHTVKQTNLARIFKALKVLLPEVCTMDFSLSPNNLHSVQKH